MSSEMDKAMKTQPTNDEETPIRREPAQGEFPFPLDDDGNDSQYVAWIRSHSKYLASNGLVDYLRAAIALTRGVVVNFLIVLPGLIASAMCLAYCHHWLIAHPFAVTRAIILIAAVGIIIVFPLTLPIFKVWTHRSSLRTGNESTVLQRDLVERISALVVAAMLVAIFVQSLPWALELLRRLSRQGTFGWQSVYAGAVAVLGMLSQSGAVLSRLSGFRRGLALALIGGVGFMIPLGITLYATAYFLYGLPPSHLVRFALLIVVPLATTLMIAVAAGVGLVRRSFTALEFSFVGTFCLSGILVVLLVLVVYRWEEKETVASVSAVHKALREVDKLAAALQDLPFTNRLPPEAAGIANALVEAHRLYALDGRAVQEARWTDSSTLDDCQRDGRSDEARVAPKNSRLAYAAVQIEDVFRCWRADELADQLDRELVANLMPIAFHATQLSVLPSEELGALRRMLGDDARRRLREEMVAKEQVAVTPGRDRQEADERVAAKLRYALFNHYIASDVTPETEFSSYRAGEGYDRLVSSIRKELESKPGTELATLLSERVLYDYVAGKFAAEPGKADTARLLGKEALVQLLTPSELLNLSFPTHAALPSEMLAPETVHLERFYESQIVQTACTGGAEVSLVQLATLALDLQYYKDGCPQPGPQRARAARLELARHALRRLSTPSLATLAFTTETPSTPESPVPPNECSLKALAQTLSETESGKAWTSLPSVFGKCFGALPASAQRWPEGQKLLATTAFRALDGQAGRPATLAAVARDELLKRSRGTRETEDDRLSIMVATAQAGTGVFSNDELVELVASRFWSRDTVPSIDRLISALALGIYGPLDPRLLAGVDAEVTQALFAPKLVVVGLSAFLLWLGWWLTVDVNQTSIHSFYRDRLASAFLLTRLGDGNFGIEDDVDLSRMCNRSAGSVAPYHLINAALNLQGATDVSVRGRRADYFIFSKHFVGGPMVSYCRTESLEEVFPQISVATAMAVSAAAAAPNMGRATSPVLVAVMTLLNIRLGFWLPNPGALAETEDAPAWRRWRPHRPSGYTFKQVFEAELNDIALRWEGHYDAQALKERLGSSDTDSRRAKVPAVGRGLVGLALSGGGVRSAALNLGLVQELHRRGVFEHVDYMSTVSGGGYIGASISTLMREKSKPDTGLTGPVETPARDPRTHDKPNRRRDSLGDRFLWRVRPHAFAREFLSCLDEMHAWVNLSDGGHIENLGVIELLRRRCKFILVGDGGADPGMRCSDLATLTRLAQVDLGVRIDIRVEGHRPRAIPGSTVSYPISTSHWSIGTVLYPATPEDPSPELGYLLFMKSSMTGDETLSVCEYRDAHPDFPHQTTLDQSFDEEQFEAYRSLGQHIAEAALKHAPLDDSHRLSFPALVRWFQQLAEHKDCRVDSEATAMML